MASHERDVGTCRGRARERPVNDATARPRTRQGSDRLLRYGAMEAAFFDLDKTIIAKSSVLAFGGRSIAKASSRSARSRAAIYAQIVYMLVGADEEKMESMREAMLAAHEGLGPAARRARSCARRSRQVITPIIYAEALDLIEEHNAAGRKTVIISSSPFEVVAADRRVPRRRRRHRDPRPDRRRRPLHGRARVLRVRAAQGRPRSARWPMPKASTSRRRTRTSDSITDLPMLEAVGNPGRREPRPRARARAHAIATGRCVTFVRPVRLRDRVPVPPKGPTIAAGSALAAVGTGAVVYLWLRRRSEVAPPTPNRAVRRCGPS